MYALNALSKKIVTKLSQCTLAPSPNFLAQNWQVDKSKPPVIPQSPADFHFRLSSYDHSDMMLSLPYRLDNMVSRILRPVVKRTVLPEN